MLCARNASVYSCVELIETNYGEFPSTAMPLSDSIQNYPGRGLEVTAVTYLVMTSIWTARVVLLLLSSVGAMSLWACLGSSRRMRAM